MRTIMLVGGVVAATLSLVAFACSSDTPAATGGTSGGGTSGGSTSGSAVTIIPCGDTDFTDLSQGDAGAVTITFPTGEPAQYAPNCIIVKAGTVVTFSGSFANHPLTPGGGDSGNPIPSTSADTASGTVDVTMATAGTFGFHCSFHPEQMFGAIKVVP